MLAHGLLEFQARKQLQQLAKRYYRNAAWLSLIRFHRDCLWPAAEAGAGGQPLRRKLIWTRVVESKWALARALEAEIRGWVRT